MLNVPHGPNPISASAGTGPAAENRLDHGDCRRHVEAWIERRKRRACPVMDRRQRLTAKTRIGHRFVPAYAADGIRLLACRIGAELPFRPTGPVRGVDESRACLVPRQRLSVLDERQPVPISGVVVTTCVDELLELPVRDLAAGNQELRNLSPKAALPVGGPTGNPDRNVRARHHHHVLRHAAEGNER